MLLPFRPGFVEIPRCSGGGGGGSSSSSSGGYTVSMPDGTRSTHSSMADAQRAVSNAGYSTYSMGDGSGNITSRGNSVSTGSSGGGGGSTSSRASSPPPSRPANLGGSTGSSGGSSGGARQVPVPGFTSSAIAPTSSPRPVERGGDGGGGIMSTAATYLPGGVNTRNPGSFVNESAARLVPNLPSFGSGVSTERVANPFAGGSDGPSDLEAERARLAALEAQMAEQAAAAQAPSLADEVQAGAETELSVLPPPPPPPVSLEETIGAPQMPISMDMLPPISQFQQPQQLAQMPQSFLQGFPQPQPLPPMQQPVTFDSIYGPDFFPPRGLMG